MMNRKLNDKGEQKNDSILKQPFLTLIPSEDVEIWRGDSRCFK